MAADLEDEGLDWEGGGYAACPPPPPGGGPPEDPWALWLGVLAEARQARFDRVPALLDAYFESDDPVFQLACTTLAGDAGTTPCFARAEAELRAADGFETALDFSALLAARGRLGDVSLLLETYLRFATVRDSDFIARSLSDLLEPTPGPVFFPDRVPGPDAYRSLVTRLAGELGDRLGSAEARVFKGEPYGVPRLARRMLGHLTDAWFGPSWRRRFEASTGIDCSPFYHDRRFRPLAAAEILEDFLESPEAAKYEDSVRYFFGHRIPD